MTMVRDRVPAVGAARHLWSVRATGVVVGKFGLTGGEVGNGAWWGCDWMDGGV